MAKFDELPVEILLTIHLYSLSSTLPLVCKRFYSVFKSVTPYHKALYLFFKSQRAKHCKPPRFISASAKDEQNAWSIKRNDPNITGSYGTMMNEIFTNALQYSICDYNVCDILDKQLVHWCAQCGYELPLYRAERLARKHFDTKCLTVCIQLPRRLFRRPNEEKIQLIKYIVNSFDVNTDSHDGYPLAKSLKSSNMDLVNFLLEHGADPFCKNAYSFGLAINQSRLDIAEQFLNRLKQSFYFEKYRQEALNMCLEHCINGKAYQLVDELLQLGAVPSIENLKNIGNESQHTSPKRPTKKRKRK